MSNHISVFLYKWFWFINIFEKTFLKSDNIHTNLIYPLSLIIWYHGISITLIPPSKLSWAPPIFLLPRLSIGYRTPRLCSAQLRLCEAKIYWEVTVGEETRDQGPLASGDQAPVRGSQAGDSEERFPLRVEICCSLHFNSHYRVSPI